MRQLGARTLPAARPRARRPGPPRLLRLLPRWLRVSLPRAALLLALCAVAASGAWCWRTGLIASSSHVALAYLIDGSAKLGLAVGDVLVEGRKETRPELLLTALGVKRGAPLLAFDLAAARTRLEALPWVRRAAVERRWPNLVYVRIEERRPVALWQYEGRIAVVDGDGEPIAGADIHRFANLPQVVGEGAAKQASALAAMLAAQPDLATHVTSAIWVGNRRWNLELQEGIELRLPESDAAGALARFATVEHQQRLLARDVVMIDLRLPDRLIVRLAPGAAPSPPPSGAKGGKST